MRLAGGIHTVLSSCHLFAAKETAKCVANADCSMEGGKAQGQVGIGELESSEDRSR